MTAVCGAWRVGVAAEMALKPRKGSQMGGRAGRRHDGAEEVVLALVQGHAGELLRFARRFSLCADDAQDAYQRALEILVRRLRTQSVDNPLSYLRTIVRHEAYQVR